MTAAGRTGTKMTWQDFAGGDTRALDRGAAGGGDRAARAASAGRRRCHHRPRLSRPRAALLPKDLPATFLPLQDFGVSVEHAAYPGTITCQRGKA